MAACPAFDPSGPYVTGLTGFVDCQVQALGENGYLALGTGSSFGLALTGMLTIYVALLGYRMLLGDAPTLRGGVVAMVKIGFVIALAQQWPAYQALVYRVVVDGPGELGTTILSSSGLADARGPDAAQRVQAAYVALSPSDAPANTLPNTNAAATGPAVPVPSGLGTPPLANATTERAGQILVLSSLGGLLSVRIVAALLLALGPLFATLLLFGATRGLFEGWVRGLVGAALASVGVATTIMFELAVLEPQVAMLTFARQANLPVPLLPGEILVTTLVFTAVLLVVMFAAVRVTSGFRIPRAHRPALLELRQMIDERTGASAPSTSNIVTGTALNERSRVIAIADAAEAAARRDMRLEREVVTTTARGEGTDIVPPNERSSGAPVPLGQTSRRRTAIGETRTAARREARA